MIIKKLKAERFGKHEQFSFDCDGPTVGVLGANGTGKSTILDLIEFLITGETRDNLDSYVKNLDGNARGEMTFVKGGREGFIMRQIGKTSKRLLRWDGVERTKSADVERIMADIFGADKKAVSNAVFVNQGELMRILFDKESNRKDMFIRIVNLAFCAKRVGIIDNKIRLLSSTIEDLSAQYAAAREAMVAAETEYISRQKELTEHPNWLIELDFCETQIATETALAQDRERANRLQIEVAERSSVIDAAFSKCQCVTIQDLRDKVADLNRTLKECQLRRVNMTAVLTDLTHYDNHERAIQELKEKIEEHKRQHLEVNPNKYTADFITVQIAMIDNIIHGLTRRNWLEEQVKARQESIAALQKTVIAAPAFSREQVESWRARQSEVSYILQTQSNWVKAQREIKACKDFDTTKVTKCVKCGVDLIATQLMSDQQLAEADEKIKAWAKEVEELRKNLLQSEREWTGFDFKVQKKKSEIDYLSSQLMEYVREFNAIPIVDNMVNLTDKRNRWQALHKSEMEFTTLLSEMTRELLGKVRFQFEEKNFAYAKTALATRHLYTPEANADLQRDLSEIETTTEWWEQMLLTAETDVAYLLRMSEEQKALRTEIERKVERLNVVIPNTLQSVMDKEMPGYDLRAVRHELNLRQETRQKLIGAVEQAQRTFTTAKDTFVGIEARIKADEGKRKLVTELQRLKYIVSDEGLPMAWVRYQFVHLARLTQESLSKLNANFRIMIDTEADLGFSFIRLDETGSAVLPMNKLSGGQRVRLCVAFLMAVQKRLVPEVGLLVLDEPSTHVDAEGIESLAGLLGEAQQELINTESQIWVVDHAPAIRTALTKYIELV